MKPVRILVVCKDVQQFIGLHDVASGLPIHWRHAKTTKEADHAIAQFRPRGVIWLPKALNETEVWRPKCAGAAPSLTILRSNVMADILGSTRERRSIVDLLEGTCPELKKVRDGFMRRKKKLVLKKPVRILLVSRGVRWFATFRKAASGLPIRWRYATTTPEAFQEIINWRPRGVIWTADDLQDVPSWQPSLPRVGLNFVRTRTMAETLGSRSVRSAVRALLEETCPVFKRVKRKPSRPGR